MRAKALLTCLVLLNACTAGGDEPAPGPSASSAPLESLSPTPSPSFSGFTEDQEVLDVAVTEPSTLDPMRIRDPASVLIARQLYEGLTAWDQSLEEVVPAAAESWEVSNGGRRFTFKIRPGITFHDGSPITSEDFRYAFDRIAQRSNASEIAYTLEHVQGFSAVNQTGSANRLSGIKTPDAETLVIELATPFYEFPAVLTHPGLAPLSRQAVEDERTFLTMPVGNGPFQMATPWSPGGPVVMERFPGFVRTPPLDGIVFHPFPDAAAAYLGFVDQEFEVAEVPVGQTDTAAEVYGDRGYVPFMAAYNLGFNLRSGSLGDPRLRRAVSMGIDRAFIAEEIYRGTMLPPRGIVPVGMPGFQENVCGSLCEHRPAQAARLVRRLPRSQRSIRIDSTEGQPHTSVVRSIKSDLEEIGLKVEVRTFGVERFIEVIQVGEQEAYRLSWIAEFPSADAFLGTLFASEAPDNYSGFSSSKVDALLAEARAEASPGRRQQLYIAAERAILERSAIVPIGSFVTHWVAHEDVEDIVFDVMGGFDAVNIDLTG